jgi:hypothetical protein
VRRVIRGVLARGRHDEGRHAAPANSSLRVSPPGTCAFANFHREAPTKVDFRREGRWIFGKELRELDPYMRSGHVTAVSGVSALVGYGSLGGGPRRRGVSSSHSRREPS